VEIGMGIERSAAEVRIGTWMVSSVVVARTRLREGRVETGIGTSIVSSGV